MPSASGSLVCAAAVTTTVIEAEGSLHPKGGRDLNETVIEIAYDRRRLLSAREAVVDAQDFCARARLVVQESQELLRRVDDLHRTGKGPVLPKNKYVVDR
jgi:hypothetical protein